jgi:hypothetical protein
MFISLPDHEAHFPRGLMPPNARCWRALSLSLCVPWFVMSARLEESRDFVNTFILASDQDVAASIKTLEGEVTSLLCMHPRHVDERIDWEVHAISEVWLATHRDNPELETLLFVARNGLEISGLFGDRPTMLVRSMLLATVGGSSGGRVS